MSLQQNKAFNLILDYSILFLRVILKSFCFNNNRWQQQSNIINVYNNKGKSCNVQRLNISWHEMKRILEMIPERMTGFCCFSFFGTLWNGEGDQNHILMCLSTEQVPHNVLIIKKNKNIDCFFIIVIELNHHF